MNLILLISLLWLFISLLCYDALRYIALCHVMLCCIMLLHVVTCYVILRHGILLTIRAVRRPRRRQFVGAAAADFCWSARRREKFVGAPPMQFFLCIYFVAIFNFWWLKKRSSENVEDRTKFFAGIFWKSIFSPPTPRRPHNDVRARLYLQLRTIVL